MLVSNSSSLRISAISSFFTVINLCYCPNKIACQLAKWAANQLGFYVELGIYDKIEDSNSETVGVTAVVNCR